MRIIFISLLLLFPFQSIFAQFSEPLVIGTGEGNSNRIKSIHTTDVDGDGDLDIIVSFKNPEEITWFENYGNRNFSEKKAITPWFFGSNSQGRKSIRIADMDKDGDGDIISSSSSSSGVLWYENYGNGNFSEKKFISNRADGIFAIDVVDLDEDGDLDVVFATDTSDDKVAWYRNEGQGNFSNEIVLFRKGPIWENGNVRDFHIVDLDRDGDMDIILVAHTPRQVTWLENKGNGSFNDPHIFDADYGGLSSIHSNDLDGDGDMDILISASTGNTIAWYENDGNEDFSQQRIISSVDIEACFVHSVDLDGDLDIDVISASYSEGSITWYENDGKGNFSPARNISYDTDRFCTLVTEDIDGDGDIDILSASNPSIGNPSVLWLESFIDYPSVYGITFWDKNLNKEFDNSEPIIRNIPIRITPQAISAHSYTEGIFRFYLDNDTYTVSANPNSCWELTTDSSSFTVQLNENIELQKNFGFALVSDLQSIQPRLQSAPTRCGFKVPFLLSVENDGCSPVAGQYGFVLDTLATFISSEIEPSKIQGDTLIWEYQELISSEIESINLVLEIAGVEFIGEEIQLKGLSYIEDENGELELAKTYDYRSEIRCAYDPNDKLITPNRLAEYDQNYTLFDESLEYTVRFQNTGNDTAFNVVIRDTLDKNLDWETFKPILASHPFETLLYKDGQVEFSFKNILLPDSTTNEPLSHGFVTYKILPKKDLPENTVIENTAGIYFDFNPPIITNTTMNVLVSELPKTTAVSEFALEQAVKVYPNPFGDFLTIKQEVLHTNKLSQLSVFDVAGRQVQSTILTNATQQISTAHLANGLYFYQVINADGQMVANGKVVKH